MKKLNAAIAEAGTAKPAAFGSVAIGDYTLAFEAATYKYGGEAPLAVHLHVMDGDQPVEPFCDVTSCVQGASVAPDEIIVKTYNESEIIRDPLLASGYFVDTGRRVASGFAELEVWKLTRKFVDAFAVTTPFDAAAAVPVLS